MSQKIVTLGGGTGSLMVLSGLRDFHDVEVATIMAMADDGGSTGRMRKSYKMPSFGGDFRDALVGLAENEELAKVFMHRFELEGELKGHSVGNIVLLGLYEASKGDIPKALDLAHEILRVRGYVYPSTTESINLECEYEDGTIVKSQHEIDNTDRMNGKKIVNTRLVPKPKAYEKAIEEITTADKLILGPGDIYSNIVSNLLVEGIADAINNSPAKKIYVVNLMTKYNQTHGMKSSDFVAEIERYLGGQLDYVVVNDSQLPEEINEKYKDEKWFMVEDDTTDDKHYQVIRGQMWLEGQEFKRVSSDVVPRSFIRHDPQRIAQAVYKI